MAIQFLGVSIMNETKDRLDNPVTQTQIDNLIDAIARDFPTINIIDVTVPMNTNAEALSARGSSFAIEPATYAARFNTKIHAVGKKVYWRATDSYFEGIYSFPKQSRRNGTRYDFFGDNIVDDFSSSSTRTHGYGETSAAGNLSSHYLTSHQSGNTWSISGGELIGPPANAWRRTCLYNANYLANVTMTAKVKKVGNQMIVVRASTDQNFPGYGLQMRDAGTLRIERPGLENLGEVTGKAWVEGNYYMLKLEAIGTTIRGKSWAYGGAEPGGWDISITNSTYTYGYCGFGGESDSGVFDDMTITPAIDTGSWMYSSGNWIRNNISLFSTGDVICPFPEASSHQSLTNNGTYNQFFIDQKYVLGRIGTEAGKTFNVGYAAHLYTAAIQNSYASIFSDAGVDTYDHYGTSIGLNKRFLSATQGAISGSAAYSLTSALNEGATHTCTFIPEKVAYNTDIDIYIINKGTGSWTMEIHTPANARVQMPQVNNFNNKTTTGIVTIPNANLTSGALNTFTINWDNPVPDQPFHFHLYSSDGTGTALVTTGTSLANAVFRQYKGNASADALEIDIRKMYALDGRPQFIGEWGDYWSTDAALSSPTRTQSQHEAYLATITAALQSLINSGILVGFCYWRILGGQEAIMYDADGGSGWDYQMLYEGQVWKTFFDANNPDGGPTTSTSTTSTSSSTSTTTSRTTSTSTTSTSTSLTTSTTLTISTSTTATQSITTSTSTTSTSSSTSTTSTSTTTTVSNTTTTSTSSSSSTSKTTSTSTTSTSTTNSLTTSTSSSISTSTSTTQTMEIGFSVEALQQF